MAGRRRRETYAPTRDLVSRAKDWTVVGTMVVVTATVVGGIWSYSKPVLDSGPMPFPSREEVKEVRSALDKRDADDDKLHTEQLGQLQHQGELLQQLSAAQRATDRERLANQVSAAQSALDVAKALYEKDQSLANQKVVDALKSRLDDLHNQLMQMQK